MATLIVMMTWSITYHSWMGFVLLCWSCVIWMMPNSRQAALRSSPFLVLYAIVLLIIQYVVSLNVFTIPDPSDYTYLDELGLRFEPYDLAYKSLFIKLGYSLVFYITLRQHVEEHFERSQQRRQLTVDSESPSDPSPSLFAEESGHHTSTAADHSNNWPVEMHPSLLKVLDKVQIFLCKYWILIVTLLLMIMSMSGNKVVLYRIAYMLLFLSFVLVFQISYCLWRRLMYSFWLLVIVYSMTVLVAIYTYQFRDFKFYWQDFLHVPLDWQTAIGLEEFKHDPLLLFNQLFTPTFFIIITIIQLHFFHQKFLKLSDLDQVGSEPSTPVPSQSTELTSPNNSISSPARHLKSLSYRPESSSSDRFVSSLQSDQVTITLEGSLSETNPTPSTSTSTMNPLKKSKRSEVIDQTSPITNSSFTTKSSQQPEKETDATEVDPLVEEIRSESPLFGISTESMMDILLTGMKSAYELVWRVLELHILKLVFICAMIAATNQVRVFNLLITINFLFN